MVFYNLLDVSALNAFIIWIYLNPNWMNGILYKHKIFFTELGKQLDGDNAARRAVKSPISSSLFPAGTNTSSVAGKKSSCCVLSTFKECKAQYYVFKVPRIYLQRSLGLLQLLKQLKLEKLCRVI